MAKQEFLKAVEQYDHAAFLTILQHHGSKRSTVDLEEILIELNRKQKEQIWVSLHSWTDVQLKKLVEDNGPEGDVVEPDQPPDEQSKGPPQNDGSVSQSCQDPPQIEGSASQGHQYLPIKEPSEPYNAKLMEGILQFASIYLNTFKEEEIFIPDKLLEFAVLLHGMVTVLEGAVQARVLSLCELWWLRKLEEREHLIGNVLPLLLDVATGKTARKKDVIRLWSLNDALQVIDLNNSENERFVERLVASAACTVFLSCDEGVKWIAGLFSWASLVPLLHQSIKTVLPDCTRLQSAKYAEVYFRAWKSSQGDVKKTVEENCLQDLMYSTVHVNPMSGRLSANLHHLLHHIHRQKRHHAVATTIYCLYDPFLWRSLKVANGLVRMNATALLCDAFPLMDSYLNQEERGNLLEKQYQTIITLLIDPCHLVRIAAIKGVSSILASFWLTIPSDIIKTIFQKLLSDLVYDASSAEVRTQVIKGLTLLVDSRDAAPFLIEVLPRIADVFDDISANVRIAFVKLLLKVKSSKVIRYWDIIPVPHLLHRMEEDKPVVCKLLTQLLFSSFHPVHQEDEEILQRCLSLLEENRAAARRFYRYASNKLDINSTVHFMLLIWRCVRNYVLAQQSQDASYNEENDISDSTSSEEGQPVPDDQGHLKRAVPRRGVHRAGHGGTAVMVADKENTAPGAQRSRASTTVKESEPGKGAVSSSDGGEAVDEDDGGDGSPLDNPDIIGGLLDTVVILWTSNAHKLVLSQNLKYLEALRTRLSRSMPLFFKFFKDNRDVSQTLLYLSSFLPRALVPTLVGHCLSRLRALQQDQENEDTYGPYVNALCNWNRADDVLELASEWLEEAMKVGSPTGTKTRQERRQSGRGVRFRETNVPQPIVALRLIRHILQHPLNKLSTMEMYRHMLLEITYNMDKVKDRINERLSQAEELSPLCSDVFLCECWSQYLSLVAVLNNPPVEGQQHNDSNERDDDGENQEDLLFDSSENVSLCWNWANRLVVPVLAEEDGGGGKRKLRDRDVVKSIAMSVLNALLKTSTSLLMIGAANTIFVYKLCGFVDGLLKIEASGSFWQNSLLLATEAHEFLQTYEHLHEADEDSEDVTPVHIINTCISSTSDHFKLQDNLPKDAEEIHDTLVQVLTSLDKNSRQDLSEVMVHMAATIVRHVCWTVDKSKGVHTEVTKIEEVGGCVALLIGVCQSRAKLSTALMDAITRILTTATRDITSLLAISYLLKILAKDSGKISRYSLKQAVIATDSIFNQIVLPLSLDEDEESNIALGLYEKYTKMIGDYIKDLKSSLGVL